MKKLVSMLAVVCAAFVMAGCGGSDSPKGIADDIYRQMQKGNYEKAIKIYTDHLAGQKDLSEADKAQRDQLYSALVAKAVQGEEKDKLKSYEIVKEEIAEDGETALVEVKLTGADEKEETQMLSFVKEDGDWKIKERK